MASELQTLCSRMQCSLLALVKAFGLGLKAQGLGQQDYHQIFTNQHDHICGLLCGLCLREMASSKVPLFWARGEGGGSAHERIQSWNCFSVGKNERASFRNCPLPLCDASLPSIKTLQYGHHPRPMMKRHCPFCNA